MTGVLPDRPPGMGWLEFLIDVEGDVLGWGAWTAIFALVVLTNASLMLLSAWIERRHDRRLACLDAATAGILLLPGKPPSGVTGTPRLVQATIVMSPAPLGRLGILLRRIFGGRVVTRQRDLQRTRRLVLMRLREQAVAAGAAIVGGVEIQQIGMGKNRYALIATGTALVGPPLPAGTGKVAEAIGAEPRRHGRELVFALIVLFLFSGGAVVAGDLADQYAGQIWKQYGGHKWKQYIHRNRGQDRDR